MTTEDSSGPSAAPDSGSKAENSKVENGRPETTTGAIPDGMNAQRVFKKASPNQKLTLYLSSRDLVVSSSGIDRLQGVLLVDPEFVENRKVYGQVTLTFRYGREDEEVMGLKFCNEAIMCLAQLYPPHPGTPDTITPLQEALLKRLGPNAYPFNMEITPLAPPSVQLVPAKEYNGAPIGTSYDIRAYVADRADEKLHRRTTVRMGIRVVQRAFAPPSPHMYVPGGGGNTCKERAKQNMKALLSGCKSAPLEATFTKGEQAISRSAETMPQGYTKLNNIGDSPEIKMKNCRLPADTTIQIPSVQGEGQPPNEDTKCGTHVSFREQPHDEIRTPPKGIQGAPLAEEETESPDDSEAQNEPAKSAATHEGDKTSVDGDKKMCDYYRSLCGAKRPSLAAYLAGVPAPKAYAEKFYMLSDGKIYLTASLDKAIYSHGEEINVNVQIENNSNKTIKRIKVFVVQHVDVCMFSNGKFKNVVAMLNAKEDCPIHHEGYLDKTYTLIPMKSSTKNWIALEDSYTKSGTSLSSTVTSTVHNPDDRNVFAIYVSYYVKVKLLVSLMGGEVSLKLPFTLMHTCTEFEHAETLTRVRPDVRLQLKSDASAEPIKPEKDGT